ncbi:MAG: hypothetical protein QXL67_03355 [Candidatus Bathyarchaeia archaeon]
MRRGKVFISGPIQGMELRQGYRERIKNIVLSCGYEAVDPWMRERILYRHSEGDWWVNVPPKDFIERDLRDIDGCDFLVAYMPKLSAGTCMELFYAKVKGKKTVVVSKLKNLSPWITAHADVLIPSFRDLKKVLESGL